MNAQPLAQLFDLSQVDLLSSTRPQVHIRHVASGDGRAIVQLSNHLMPRSDEFLPHDETSAEELIQKWLSEDKSVFVQNGEVVGEPTDLRFIVSRTDMRSRHGAASVLGLFDIHFMQEAVIDGRRVRVAEVHIAWDLERMPDQTFPKAALMSLLDFAFAKVENEGLQLNMFKFITVGHEVDSISAFIQSLGLQARFELAQRPVLTQLTGQTWYSLQIRGSSWKRARERLV